MDYIVSATAGNAQIRCFACTARDLVEKARQLHNTSPVMTAALGRLLIAGAMMGSTMKGEKDLLTLQIAGDGPAKGLTVTADSAGHVKGYANVPDVILPAKANGKLDVSGAIGAGMLGVIRDLGLKEPYAGHVPLQTGEIAEDLTYYFAASEQIPSSVGLGVLMNKDNTVSCAGGFIIQLLPFATDETIARLEENLRKIPSVTQILSEGATPEDLLRRVLQGMEIEFQSTLPCEYRCDCSAERIERALISLGRKELQNLIDEGREVEICCEFCGSRYTFSVEEMKALLQKATRA
ncbi:MAG: Hsp33 family molecular chaperone HslO [Lachnospiraceae bacterium]|nr:Hsp33 family molecular chaperone HslO [Lachnospiraceae bacterium]MCR5476391.1 Hsp33 family molecular chaperone HslO [Lachnospiraceae bacterium]